MAGIQIDGVNNKIDFDDDADTSISSSTDDTLVIESGGVNVASITSGEFAINEGSGSIDFRVESDDDANMLLVDASGNAIGVGTNSPALTNGRGIVIHGGSSIARLELRNDTSGATDADGAFYTYSGTDAFFGNREAGTVQFWNNGAERMRINSAGEVGIGLSSFDSQLTVQRSTAGGSYPIFGIHSASSGTVRILRGSFNAQAPDDRTSVFITMGDSSATRFNVHADGDVDNHDNFFGQISDERIKSNITDANSQWDDIKAIKFRNFERKDDIAQYGDGKKVQIGVVAQELETVSPGLVRETEPSADDIKMSSEFGTLYEDGDTIPEDKNIGDIKTTTGEKVKAVAYSVLYIKAAKALQEAMARIETLETKVAALEGN